MTEQGLTIQLDAGLSVSAVLQRPAQASACLVLAHGAGAGMHHAFMAGVAAGLAERGTACLRYQFPAMERGSKRPDTPALAQATVRAAVAEAAQRCPGMHLFAGGKSFGGRMSSQAQAELPLPGVEGLVLIGFPLHPPRRPSQERAAHLARVQLPMLFLQGTRDELAELALLQPTVDALGPRATLALFDDADHAFHVRARSGRNDAQVLAGLLDRAVAWMGDVQQRTPATRTASPLRSD